MVICDQTGTACQHGNDCLLRGVCRLIPNHGLGNLIASQPYSTNQAPAAPSLEQLEKDAARYRWLRDKSFNQYRHPIVIEQRGPDAIPRYIGPLFGELLDKQIDAAMLTSCPDKT